MNLTKLKDPFNPLDVEFRIGRCGVKNEKPWAMALAYITARAIHDRLDEVCAQENWQLRYVEHLGETICEIGIKFGQEWIWKAGGAGRTEFEPFKGGLSSAEKRAGVPWGIGRYLYNLSETFVECSLSKNQDWNYQSKNDKKGIPAFYWKTPALPAWALPKGEAEREIPEQTKLVDQNGALHGSEKDIVDKPILDVQKKTITNKLGKEGMDEVQIADFFNINKVTFDMANDILKRADVYAKEYFDLKQQT